MGKIDTQGIISNARMMPITAMDECWHAAGDAAMHGREGRPWPQKAKKKKKQ